MFFIPSVYEKHRRLRNAIFEIKKEKQTWTTYVAKNITAAQHEVYGSDTTKRTAKMVQTPTKNGRRKDTEKMLQ